MLVRNLSIFVMVQLVSFFIRAQLYVMVHIVPYTKAHMGCKAVDFEWKAQSFVLKFPAESLLLVVFVTSTAISVRVDCFPPSTR